MHVTVATDRVQLKPCEAVADTKVIPVRSENTSVMTTPVASLLPPLVTMKV